MVHLTESFHGERLAGISISASWRETPEVGNFSEWRIVTGLSFNNTDAFKPAGADPTYISSKVLRFCILAEVFGTSGRDGGKCRGSLLGGGEAVALRFYGQG